MQYQHKVKLLFLVFIGWLGLTSLVLFKFGNQYYGQFSFDTDWQNTTLATFSLPALGITESKGIQVVHVSAEGCICNRNARLHQQQFAELYAVTDSQQFNRNIQQVSVAGFNLPATPAVLIFSSGKLLYAGPYATGPMCSTSDSLIAPILLQQVTLHGTWLNAEAKSCRCVVKKVD